MAIVAVINKIKAKSDAKVSKELIKTLSSKMTAAAKQICTDEGITAQVKVFVPAKRTAAAPKKPAGSA